MDRLKTMIGRVPVSPRFADEIGADGYAADAGAAVEIVRAVLS
ncbi:hypothetical protein [Acididesulfobacillus acetoxydans]|nr:hypothetical protein [Acididesulfobacillus acetoxydans]